MNWCLSSHDFIFMLQTNNLQGKTTHLEPRHCHGIIAMCLIYQIKQLNQTGGLNIILKEILNISDMNISVAVVALCIACMYVIHVNHVNHLTVDNVASEAERPRALWLTSLQWRHNGRDSVSNHQRHDCLLNRLFRRRSKKTSKLCVTGLCEGNSPRTNGQLRGKCFHLMTSSCHGDVMAWKQTLALCVGNPSFTGGVFLTKGHQYGVLMCCLLLE